MLIVVSLSVFAFTVYVPVAYKHAQTLLGTQLTERAAFALKQFAKSGVTIENSQMFVDSAKPFTVGRYGYIIAINQMGAIVTPNPQGFTHLREEIRWEDQVEALRTGRVSNLTSHFRDTRYLVTAPYGSYRLISFVSESDFLDELYPLLIKSIIVGIIFGVVFMVLTVLFINGIAGPINRVVKAARAMVEHRQPYPIVVATGDEIEILADEFTEMATQLRQYEKDLERKIAERTAQLAKTNSALEEKTAVLEHVLEDVKKVDEELSRLNHAKSEFISMASHQLRTPLTAIKWYAKILSNGGVKKLSPTQLRAYHQIVSANERMIELVNALLNVSRIEMGTLAVEPAKVDAASIIEHATQDIRAFALERGVHFKVKSTPNITLITDEKLLNIVITNLLSNAVRYTPKGGTVSLQLAQIGGRVTLEVKDTGYGIPKKDHPLIFSKFFRASNILDKEPQGTGLGLYLTKSIVGMLKGKITFASRVGKGTTFIVSLPTKGLKAKKGIKGLIPIS